MKIKFLIKESSTKFLTTLPIVTSVVKANNLQKEFEEIKKHKDRLSVLMKIEKMAKQEDIPLIGNWVFEHSRNGIRTAIVTLATRHFMKQKDFDVLIQIVDEHFKNTLERKEKYQSEENHHVDISVSDFITEYKSGITIEEAREMFKQLGRGAFRTVFRMPQGFVLKVASGFEGKAANESELEFLNAFLKKTNQKSQHPSIQKLFVKPIARADDFSWVLFEKIDQPTFELEEFYNRYKNVADLVRRMTGLPLAEDIKELLRQIQRGINQNFIGESELSQIEEAIREHPEFEFIWNHREEKWAKDLHGANVGLREDGSLVIFDLGLIQR